LAPSSKLLIFEHEGARSAMMGKSIAAQERENAHMNMVEGPNGQYRPEGMQYEGASLAGAATGLSAQSGDEVAGMRGQTEPKAEFVQAEGTTRARSEDERASERAAGSHLADPGAAQRVARVPETGTLTSGIVSAQVVTGGLDATPEVPPGPLREKGRVAARAAEHAVQDSSETEESADD
jgi:hypothetical protein